LASGGDSGERGRAVATGGERQLLAASGRVESWREEIRAGGDGVRLIFVGSADRSRGER